MSAKADVVEWERLALNAWPAPSNLAFGNWLFRTGGGYTKRANSANAFTLKSPTTADGFAALRSGPDFHEVVVEAERYYTAHGQPAIFRLTPLAGTGADAILAAAGYEFLEPSHVMVAPLKAVQTTGDIRIDRETATTWLDGIAAAQMIAPGHRALHDRIVKSIAAPKAFATAYLPQDAVGFGLAVAERGAVGLFDIVVRAEARGLGLGRELTLALMAWGRTQGAEAAYLQVTAANRVAVRLYESLGFQTLYDYHYRRRAL